MNSNIFASIVKSYDVRGLVKTELTPEVVRALGAAFAEVVVGKNRSMIVGHDMRISSPDLVRFFCEGVGSFGSNVISIGLCSTDMLYYASGSRDAPAAMFTASHNPADYNGIKFCGEGARGISLETGLAEIRDKAAKYVSGEMQYGNVSGKFTEESVLHDYARYLRELVPFQSSRSLRVVVDAANGMAGLTVPAVLQDSAGLPAVNIEVIPLYFELDGSFPNHEANPLEPKNLEDLRGAVLTHKADIGFAFDGDADRCFVIDNLGSPVSPSTIAGMVAKREIQRACAAGDARDVKVIHNLICSKAVAEVIVENGASPIRTPVGHSLIKQTMSESGAIFGGEHSAHYYFKSFWGADNGMLAALHVLAELGRSDSNFSDLTPNFSRYFESGEINSPVGDQDATIHAVQAAFGSRGRADFMDGLTVSGQDGGHFWWLNVRGSNTEPLLRLNVEANSPELMEQVRDEALRIIRR